jgi:hypothetical protein
MSKIETRRSASQRTCSPNSLPPLNSFHSIFFKRISPTRSPELLHTKRCTLKFKLKSSARSALLKTTSNVTLTMMISLPSSPKKGKVAVPAPTSSLRSKSERASSKTIIYSTKNRRYCPIGNVTHQLLTKYLDFWKINKKQSS